MTGIILNPLPISAVAMLGAGTCLALGVLNTQQILNGFSEKVVWLLVFAFFIARGIIKTAWQTYGILFHCQAWQNNHRPIIWTSVY
jgi:di/tricarboxylate transporter